MAITGIEAKAQAGHTLLWDDNVVLDLHDCRAESRCPSWMPEQRKCNEAEAAALLRAENEQRKKDCHNRLHEASNQYGTLLIKNDKLQTDNERLRGIAVEGRGLLRGYERLLLQHTNEDTPAIKFELGMVRDVLTRSAAEVAKG